MRDPCGLDISDFFDDKSECLARSVQSCTSRDTLGFVMRLFIFFEAGLVVMTITGDCENGEEGR